MSDLVPADTMTRAPDRVALPDATPSIEDLLSFAREAELRVRTLRMTIEEEAVDARGMERVSHEIQLRHPGQARVTTRHGHEPLSRHYEVWLSDGTTVTTFRARDGVASVRPIRGRVAGSDDPGIPAFARQYQPLTQLPAGSLADTFVHPHGLFRSVLVTGALAVIGVREVAGREAIVVRSSHPRSSKVLLDRPDHTMDVGIARDSGFLLFLTERIGEQVTRHAEVSQLLLDPVLFDAAFELRLPADVRMVY